MTTTKEKVSRVCPAQAHSFEDVVDSTTNKAQHERKTVSLMRSSHGVPLRPDENNQYQGPHERYYCFFLLMWLLEKTKERKIRPRRLYGRPWLSSYGVSVMCAYLLLFSSCVPPTPQMICWGGNRRVHVNRMKASVSILSIDDAILVSGRELGQKEQTVRNLTLSPSSNRAAA